MPFMLVLVDFQGMNFHGIIHTHSLYVWVNNDEKFLNFLWGIFLWINLETTWDPCTMQSLPVPANWKNECCDPGENAKGK